MRKIEYASLLLPIIKRQTEMELGIAKFFVYFLGIPGYIFALYVNLGTWKSDILFAAGLLFMFFNVYWRWRRNKRADKKSAQEEEMRQIEIEKERRKIR